MKIAVLDETNQNYIRFKKYILDGFLYIRKIECVNINKEKEKLIFENITSITKKNNKLGNILICIDQENIIGYLWYLKQKITPYGGYSYGLEENEYIWVHSVFVDPSMRRQGVGILLYEKLQEICKTQNVNKIYLDVFPNNIKSELFHDKLGFKKDIVIYSKTI